MIRCPLCAQLVHLNDSEVPVCDTPGCGDIPILDSQRDRRFTLEAAVESVIHGPGYACTLSDLGINPTPPSDPTSPEPTPADLGRRAEPPMEIEDIERMQGLTEITIPAGIITEQEIAKNRKPGEIIYSPSDETQTASGGVVHYFFDGKEIARHALENMPRVLCANGQQ